MNMLKLPLLMTFLLLLSVPDQKGIAFALNTYQAGETIVGQDHNDILKRWLDRTFVISAGVGEKNAEYIYFEGETGLGSATVMVKYTKATRDKFRKAIEKAMEWSNVAQKNGADTSKSLGCFGSDQYGICQKHGTAFAENQLGLLFFAANGGKQTHLVVSMVDRNNQFIKTNIYVDAPGMQKMLNAMDDFERALETARKTAKDQQLFK
jgi:hypothetical protein